MKHHKHALHYITMYPEAIEQKSKVCKVLWAVATIAIFALIGAMMAY